jgi:hypothetical protein
MMKPHSDIRVFIDRVIVPALLQRLLREHQAQRAA